MKITGNIKKVIAFCLFTHSHSYSIVCILFNYYNTRRLNQQILYVAYNTKMPNSHANNLESFLAGTTFDFLSKCDFFSCFTYFVSVFVVELKF